MESHSSPRFTPSYLLYNSNSLSLFYLCVSHSVNLSPSPPISLSDCICVSQPVSPPLFLCLLLGSWALASPLVAAIWRLCLRADRCYRPLLAPPPPPSHPLPHHLKRSHHPLACPRLHYHQAWPILCDSFGIHCVPKKPVGRTDTSPLFCRLYPNAMCSWRKC